MSLPKPALITLVALGTGALIGLAPPVWRRVHALSATTFLVVRAR